MAMPRRRKRWSLGGVLTLSLLVALGLGAWGLSHSAGGQASALKATPTGRFTLRLHGALTTGLTSCQLKAGNLFDLGEFHLTPPVLVQQARFYAQSFQGAPAGPATVRLYTAQRADSPVGAVVLVSAPPIQVSSDKLP